MWNLYSSVQCACRALPTIGRQCVYGRRKGTTRNRSCYQLGKIRYIARSELVLSRAVCVQRGESRKGRISPCRERLLRRTCAQKISSRRLSRCLYLHAPLHARHRQFVTSGHPRLKHCWCEYGTRNLDQKYSIPSAGMSACRYSHVLCRDCCSHYACAPHFILRISCRQSSEDAQGRMANPTVVMELGIQSVDNPSSVSATTGTVAGYSCIVGEDFH
jgi:hypothetical protein